MTAIIPRPRFGTRRAVADGGRSTMRRRSVRPVRRAAIDHGQTLASTTLVLAMVLASIGSIMILSASSVAALEVHGSAFSVFLKQGLWLLLGIVALSITARIDYRRWKSAVLPLLGISTVLMVLVLVPGVGLRVNGARRWIGFGALQLQPSEPTKLALILFVATLLAKHWKRIDVTDITLRPVVIVTGFFAALTMLQPNLGTTIVIVSIVGVMLFWAGTPLRPLLMLGAAGAAGVGYLALSEPYRRARITAFLDPWGTAQDTGYQTIQSLIGVASGGATGTGLGASRAKWGFLPEAHTDFVFTIIGEELGLIGAVLVVSLMAGLVGCALLTASRAPDPFGALLAVGIATWIGVQTFVNVGAVIGLLPITGVPMPLVSFGGSALVSMLAAVGILMNIATNCKAPDTTPTRRGGRTRRVERSIARRAAARP